VTASASLDASHVLGQPLLALPQRLVGDLLVDHAAADADLLLGAEERLHQLGVLADEPAGADAGDAVGLGERGDADGPRAQRRRHRQRLAEGHLAVGLIDEQAAASLLDDR
jgi:hypothetical protein